jgi:hypothetical protein
MTGGRGCVDELARNFWPPGMIAQIDDRPRRKTKCDDRASSDRTPAPTINFDHTRRYRIEQVSGLLNHV